MKEIGCLGIVEALMQQHTPAHFVESLAVCRLRGQTELLVRLLPFFKPPKAFSTGVCIAATCQSVETCLRLCVMSMLAQRPAIGRHSRAAGNSEHQQQRKRSEASHLSNPSCTFASSSSAAVNCVL